ncbi:MAG: hypothetical protein RLZZ382_1954, partial [Bacteroidota bacterium]
MDNTGDFYSLNVGSIPARRTNNTKGALAPFFFVLNFTIYPFQIII